MGIVSKTAGKNRFWNDYRLFARWSAEGVYFTVKIHPLTLTLSPHWVERG
jgi:hypothetical protein